MWDVVTPRVWIGRRLRKREAIKAVQAGVTAVLDLSAEFPETRPFRMLRYRSFPILDLTAPSVADLKEMARFVTEQSRHGIVYVHCKIGYSRSGAAVAAFLMLSGSAQDTDEALSMIRRVRPTIVVRREIVAALSALDDRAIGAAV